MKKNYVRIVGIGVMESEKCFFSDTEATGYVDMGDNEMTPVNLSLLGKGNIGGEVAVPEEWEDKLLAIKEAYQYSY